MTQLLSRSRSPRVNPPCDVPRVAEQSELTARQERLLQTEIGFIFDDSFEKLTREQLERELESKTLFLPADGKSRPRGGDPLPAYFARLYETPLLTAEGEAALFRKMNFLKFRANALRTRLNPGRVRRKLLDEAEQLLADAAGVRDQIVQSNLRLVVSIARKFADQRVTFDELVSEGNLILLKAVEKFDFARGFRFSTYVTHSVQRHFYRQFRKFQSRKSAEVLVGDDILREHAAIEANDDLPLTDNVNVSELLSKIDECLDGRERYVLLERFGLGPSGIRRTLQSLAQDLGVCKERVRQLHHKALDQLRQFAGELSGCGKGAELQSVSL